MTYKFYNWREFEGGILRTAHKTTVVIGDFEKEVLTTDKHRLTQMKAFAIYDIDLRGFWRLFKLLSGVESFLTTDPPSLNPGAVRHLFFDVSFTAFV